MAGLPQVVITGLGLVCPIGIGRTAVAESLSERRSGVRKLSIAPTNSPPTEANSWQIGGEIPDFDPKQYIKPRKAIKVMCRELQLAFAASLQAWDDANLVVGNVDPDRVGVLFGSEIFHGDNSEIQEVAANCLDDDGEIDVPNWGPAAIKNMYPLWMLKHLPNMPACHVGIALDARGPCNSITTEETSGLIAIQEAAMVIQRGHADIMVVGAVGGRLSPTRLLYRDDSRYATAIDRPESACRPFDLHRTGMVGGEGAGCFILESAEHAAKRQAKQLGTVVGWGNRYGRPRARLSGSQTAMSSALRCALNMAQINPEQIDHVNANGVGTLLEDVNEGQAIASVFGEKMPVAALKGYLGQTGAASGVIELAASIIMAGEGKVPVSINHSVPDPYCPINVSTDDLARKHNHIIKLTQCPNGHAASILVEVA